MAQRIDGKAIAAQVRAQAAREAAELSAQGMQPGLAEYKEKEMDQFEFFYMITTSCASIIC